MIKSHNAISDDPFKIKSNSSTISKGFIMAAGKGMRIRPYSNVIPKPLFTIGGESLLQRNIILLDEAFCLDYLYIITGYKTENILESIREIDNVKAKIDVINLPENYVTRGLLAGFAFISSYLESNELFVCVLGDEYYGGNDHLSFSAFVNKLEDYSVCCAIKKFNHPEEYFKNYSVIYDENTNIIKQIREKPKTIESPYFGLGLIVANKNLTELAKNEFESNRKNNIYDLINTFSKKERQPVYGYVFNDYYNNINTKTDYYVTLSHHRTTNWKRFKIDVIIPAWNEVESIGYVVKDFKSHCHNVIVMDNISKDGTADVARQAGAITYSEPLKGYGDAIRKGLDRSNADILITIEADGTYHAVDLDKIFCYLKNSDAVIGTRTYGPYIESGANMPFLQRMGNILFGGIITLLWWNRMSRFTDVGCTFKGMWREAFEKIKPQLVGNGPEFSPEVVIELLNEWQRVIEVPIPYHSRVLGTSKFSKDFLDTAVTAIKMLKLIISKRAFGWMNNLFGFVEEKNN